MRCWKTQECSIRVNSTKKIVARTYLQGLFCVQEPGILTLSKGRRHSSRTELTQADQESD